MHSAPALSPRRSPRALLLASTALLAALSVVAVPAMAQTVRWQGDTDADWVDGTNWEGDTAPADGDIARITDVNPDDQPVLGRNDTVDLGAAGQVVVAGGSLTVLGTLNAGGDVRVSAGASLTLDGVGPNVGAVTGGLVTAGTVLNDRGSVDTVAVNDGIFTNSGVITGSALVNGGELVVGANSNIGNAAAVTVNAGTLTVDAADTIGSLSAGAGSTVGGTATLTTGSFTQTGGSTAGTVTVATGTFTQSGNATVAAGTAVNATGAQTLQGGNVLGTLGGAGAVTVQTDRTDVTGAGSIASGSVTVASGALATDGGALAAASNVTVNDGAFTVDGTETIGSLDQTGGRVNGSGTINTGDFTQSGGRTGGSIDINTTTFTQSGGAIVGAGTTVTATGAQRLQGGTIAGTLDGTGQVRVETGTTEVVGAGRIDSTDVRVLSGTLQTDGGALAPGAEVRNDGTLSIGDDETVRRVTGGGTVNLDGNGTVLTLTDGVSNLSGTVQGTGGLTVSGASDTRLTGNATYTGTTTVQGGSLRIDSGGAARDLGDLVVNGGTLGLDNTAVSVDSLSGTGGTVALTAAGGASQLAFGSDNSSTAYSGGITGTALTNLAKEGTGTTTLSGTINTAGTVSVNGGTLALGGSNTITGGITVSGDSTLRLESDNAAGGAGGLITTTGSTIDYAAGVNNGTAIAIASNDTDLNVDTGSATQSGAISGAGFGLEKTGSGTLILSGTNSFGGDLVVSDGTLALANGAAVADTVEVVVGGGGTLRVDADESIGALSGTAGGGTVDVGGNELQIVGSQDTAYAGSVTGTGALLNDGTGRLELTGNGSGFTGLLGATTAGGEIALTGGGTTGASGVGAVAGATFSTDGNAILAANAVLASDGQVNLGGSETVGTLVNSAASGVATGTVTLTGAGTVLTVSGAANALNPGNVNGTSGTINGDGTLRVTGGSFGVAAGGSVQVDTDIRSGGTVVNSGAMADVSNAGTFTNAAGGTAGALTNTGTGAGSNVGTLASLNQNSNGIFDNTGTVTGATTVERGTLNLNGTSNLSDTAALTVNGGRVNVNVGETVGALAGAADGRVNLTGTLTAGGNGGTTAFDGIITGTGGLTKEGGGILTLGGANTFTGALAVNGGTLAATGTLATNAITTGAGGTLTTDGGVLATGLAVLANNGAFAMAGSETMASVTGTGTIALGGAGTVLTLTSGASTIGGIVSGTGGVTVAGGAVEMTAANTYAGDTRVTSGSLALTGAAGSVDSALVAVSGTGTLTTDGGGLDAGATVNVSGNGTVATTGAETVADLNQTGGTVRGTGSITTGDFTQSGGSTADTVTVNTGTFTQSGTATVGAGTTVAASGAQALQGGTIAGTLSGAGAVTVTGGTTTVSGSIAAASVTVNSGELSAGTNALSDGATVTVTGGAYTATGADTIALLNQSEGRVNGPGTITVTGAFTQTGGSTRSGASIVSNGFSQSGGGIIGDGTTVSSGGTKTLGGGTIDGTLAGAGAVNVVADTAVTATGAITGASAITVAAGTTLTSGGTVATTGTLTNLGTASLAGVLGGAVDNRSIFSVGTGGLAGSGGGFANSGTLNVAAGSFSGVGTLANAAGGTVNVGAGRNLTAAFAGNAGTVNVAGNAIGAFADNTGSVAVAATGTITGAFTNNLGIVTLSGGTVAGGFQNRTGGVLQVGDLVTSTGIVTGNLDSTAQAVTSLWDGTFSNGTTRDPRSDEATYDRNGSTDDVFTVGSVSGGTFRLDINLLAQASDRIAMTGAAGVDATRRVTFVTANTAAGFVPLGRRTTIMTGANIQNAFSNGQFVIRSPGSAVVQQLNVTAGGDLEVVATTSSGVGGLASSVSGIQSLISSVVNRPSSPFTGGLAAEEGCFRGGFGRFTVGTATIDAESRNLSSTQAGSTTEVSADYSGVQAGYDLGCNDGRFLNGWDGSAGVMLGYNRGSSSQTVFAPNGDLAPLATSRIDSDFDQSYFGFYVAGSRENLTADVTLRFDRTGFDLSETELLADAALGVDGESFSTSSASLIGRLSYNVELNDELAFVPTVGMSITRTKGSDVQIGSGASGGVLTLDDYSSNVVFMGGTLARTRINPDGTAANTLFVSGNYYNDLAGDRSASFTPNDDGDNNPATVPFTEQISLGNLGGFGEVSLGWNYVKILENGPGGARQMNTSVRVDTRFGSNVSQSVSLTAQVRLTF